jgi:hypothetical protein
MSDKLESQEPLLYLPRDLLAQLPSSLPMGFRARRETPKKYVDDLKKYALLVGSSPYSLGRASNYLIEWASGTAVLGEPLAVDYCSMDRVVPLVQAPLDMLDNVVSLEPKPNELRLQKTPKPRNPRPAVKARIEPSASAKQMYELACGLVAATPSLSWQDAIDVAEQIEVPMREAEHGDEVFAEEGGEDDDGVSDDNFADIDGGAGDG